MKRFWMKFLASSIVCTSLVGFSIPVLADDVQNDTTTNVISEVGTSTENVDTDSVELVEVAQDTVESTSKAVAKDGMFNILVTGVKTQHSGKANVTLELKDVDGNSLGEVTTNGSTLVDDSMTILNLGVPKYKENDVFMVYLKDADSNVDGVRINGDYLEKGNPESFVEVQILGGQSEETGENILLGHKDYMLQVDIFSQDINNLGLQVSIGNVPQYGVSLLVTDKQSGKQASLFTLDSYVPVEKDNNTKELEIKLTEGYLQFVETGKDTITVDLSKVKNGKVDLKVENASGSNSNTTGSVDMMGSKLTVNISSDYNTDLSTYWSNIIVKMQTGNTYKMLDEIKFGKNEVTLSEGKYTPTVSDSKFAKVTGLPSNVDLSKSSGSMDIKVTPTHTLQVSKSKDGKRQPYKFKVLNVPEIADKVYSGTDALEFAVMPGEAYMIQDVDSGEVLNVAINTNSTTTKVVLGEGVVTGFASVPETGDNGTPLMWGLILSLAGVFIVGSVIIYKKRELKLTTDTVKKTLSLLLVGTLVGATLIPIDVYAGSNMGGEWGSSGGSATSVPSKTGGLKGNVVRVYPAKLDQLGFDPADDDFDANGTAQILAKPDRNWLNKYSIYFTPSTSTYNKWVNNSAFITVEKGGIASGNHNSDYRQTGNYHYYDSGMDILYHDYFDSDHTNAYMKEGAKQSSTINAETKTMRSYKNTESDSSYKWRDTNFGNDNLFVNIISNGIVGKDLRVEAYGDDLQQRFSVVLKDDAQKTQLWESYKAVAKATGIYNDADFNNLEVAFQEGKLGFFVETLMGFDINGCDSSHGSNKHDTHTMFMSTNTYLKVMRLGKTGMFSYDDANREYATANKSGVGGCSGGTSCVRGPACKFFHHVGWSHANIKKAYTRTIKPSTKPIQSSGNNPFGGWGYVHMKGGVPLLAEPGVYVIIKDAIVKEPSGVTYMARSPQGSTTLELTAYEERNSISNKLKDLTGKAEIIEGVPLDGGGTTTYTLNSLSKKVKGKLKFTKETQVRVFLDSDYQDKKVTDLNTNTWGTANELGEQVGLNKDTPLTPKEEEATNTKTGSDAESIIVGGGDKTGGTNWFAEDLMTYIVDNKKTYSENKKVGDDIIKRQGDLSDVVIVVTDVEIEIPSTQADENDKVVPEWRLSRHWDKLVPTDEEVYSISGIGQPKSDGTSHVPEGYLTPSGYVSFNKKLNSSDLPPYLFSKPIWGNGENGGGTIDRSKTDENIKVQGDLLATKKNDEIDNIKVSSWVSGSPNLSDLGIGVTNKGADANRGALLGKTYTFKYLIDNPNSYTNYYTVYSHSSETCTAHDDSDDYHEIDICNCYRTSESLSDETTGSQEEAKYPTSIVYERYLPRDKVAPKFDYKENQSNGKVTLSAQSPVSLMVNPEVLMQYADISGRNSVVFTAGDKMREVKPVSYHSIEYVATVNPKVSGTAVATDNQAKALASRLNAGGSQVIYKGAGANISFDIDGKTPTENGYVETKSYILDIGNTAIKNTWNPSTSYNAQNINDQFLSKIGSKDASGKWSINGKVVEQLKIDAQLYGKNTSNLALPQVDSNVNEYRLTVRGGKLVAVNGRTDFRTSLSAETIKAFEEMTLLSDSGVLSVFDRGQGKKPESSFATLGNAMRGTTDLSTSTGWYNEDTTVLVVREYSNKFEIPVSMFVDKVPMTVPNLNTPINKMDFFTQGKTGHTIYTNTILSTGASLNPYDTTSGTKDAVSMKHDSSTTNSPFGPRTIDYVVPNVSILDTMQ